MIDMEKINQIGKRHFEFIDLLKGYGMILVIIGHVHTPNILNTFIYSFHMPLFFILSGMTIRLNKLENIDFKSFFLSKVSNYLIPYITVELFLLPLWYIRVVFINKQPIDVIKNLLGILIGNAEIVAFSSSTTWFVLTLFLSHIIFACLVKIAKGDERIIFILSLLCCLFSWTQRNINYPWHYTVAFAGVVFLYVGNLFIRWYEKAGEDIIHKLSFFLKIIYLFFFLLIGLVLVYSNHGLSMNGNRFGSRESLLLYYGMSISLSLFLYMVTIILPSFKVILFIGRNTFIFMALQAELIPLFATLVPNYSYRISFCLVIGIIIISIIFTLLINKLFPFINAKKTKVNFNNNEYRSKRTVVHFFSVFIMTIIPVYYLINLVIKNNLSFNMILSLCVSLIISVGVVLFYYNKPCIFFLESKD